MIKLLRTKTMLLLCALMAGSGSVWAQVTSAIPEDGKSYVVAAYVNSKYYALPNQTTNGGTISGTVITLNAKNKVSTSVASGKTWTLQENKYSSGQFYFTYTSGSTTYYLYKNGTGGSNYNFKVSNNDMNYWTFTSNGKGYTVKAYDRGSNNTLIQCNSGTFRCYSTATPIILLEIGDAPALKAIALSGTYKTTFYIDDTFSHDGLIVTATNVDDEEYVVTPTNVSSPDMSTTGIKTVTVSYTQDDVTETATYNITVNERPKFTVTYSDGGSDVEEAVGSGITLPSRSNEGDYSFVGWSEEKVTAGTSSVKTIAAGETYHPTDNCTIYPVYSYNAYGAVEEWEEIKEMPDNGLYAICAETYAMKAEITSNRFANGSISIVDGTPATLSTAPSAECIWEIYKADDNYYRIKNASYYAGGTNSKNNGALLTDASVDLAKWTISYNEGFAFENYGRSKASSDSGNKWLRNNASNGWATYASGTGNAPRLFKKSSVNKSATFYTSDPTGLATISINALCTDGEGKYYGTYSNSTAFVVPTGLTVSEISVSDNKLTVQNYAEGAVVPANTGVMVSATAAGDKTVSLTSESGTSVLGSDNMLLPSGDDGITAAAMTAADTKFYRLTMHNGTQIGFWWGADKGAAFSMAANKAYLAVPASAGARLQGFAFGEESTGIAASQMNSETAHGEVYNLQGQRVVSPKKGLYIVNGKKAILK